MGNERCKHGEVGTIAARLHQAGAGDEGLLWKAGEEPLAEEAEALAEKIDFAEAQARITPREVKTKEDLVESLAFSTVVLLMASCRE